VTTSGLVVVMVLLTPAGRDPPGLDGTVPDASEPGAACHGSRD
jgi:hypothetical protein